MWVRECRKSLCKNNKAKEIGDNIQICSRQTKYLVRVAGGTKVDQLTLLNNPLILEDTSVTTCG